jgi:hypothetical protein
VHKLKSFLTVLGAVTVLVLAGNTVAFAATGGKFFLGKTNKADQVSTLKRTTSGAALNLVTKSSSNAPLTTNGKGKVANLNADSLDGKDSSAFQSKVGPFVWHNLPVSGAWSTYDSDPPQYAVRLGVVYFRGSISGGTDGSIGFTVPAEARPVRSNSYVYLTVDECSGATGRIVMSTLDGSAYVVSDPADTSAANCFVSLEGVSYPVS